MPNPGPPGWREYDPPRAVWVNVPHLYPVHPGHDATRRCPAGLQVAYETEGELVAVMPAADGSALGKVRYRLHTADGVWSLAQTQFVPMHLLRPRGLERRYRAR